MKNPCFNCENRHFNCWGACDRYKAFRDDIEAKKRHLHQGREAAQFLATSTAKTQRRNGKK